MGKKRDATSPLEEDKLKKQNIGAEMEPTISGSNVIEEVSLDAIKKDMMKEISGLREELRDEIKMVSKKIGDLYTAHAETVSSVNFHGNFLETLSEKIHNLDRNLKINEKKTWATELKQRKTDYKLDKVSKDVRDNTKAIKQKNLVINGLVEPKNENSVITAVTFLKNLVPDINSTHIAKAYRVGVDSQGKKGNRPLIIQIKDPAMKDVIMKKKAQLKDNKDLKKIFCNNDVPEESRKTQQIIREIAKEAVRAGYKKVKCYENKIQIGEKTYYANELFLLPKALQLENCKTRIIGGMLRFESDFSYLSSNYSSPFLIDGIQFSSATQAFYYHKAIMCGRDDTKAKILECEDPNAVEKLGLKVDSSDEWSKKKLRVLKGVLLYKFRQNEEIREKLCNTGDAPILNCDTDLYWGTGWKMDSKDWDKSQDYPGRNALGIVLTDVRTRLSSEEAQTSATGGDEHKKPGQTDGDKDSAKSGGTHTKVASSPKKTVAEQMMDAKSLAKEIKSTEITAMEMDIPEKAVGILQNKDTVDQIDINSKAQNVPDLEAETNRSLTNEDNREDKKALMDGKSIDGEDNLLDLLCDKLGVDPKGISAIEAPRQGSKEETIEEGWSIDSITVDSIDLSASIDTSNLSLPDGRINREKIIGWTLPSLNSTALLEKSLAELKSSMTTSKSDMTQRSGPSIHSTPVNTHRGRLTKKAKKQAEKNKTLQMLRDLEI